jgi:hypothetical protein
MRERKATEWRGFCFIEPSLSPFRKYKLTQRHARPGTEDGDVGGHLDADEREDLADGGLEERRNDAI